MLSVRWSPANQMQEPAKEGGARKSDRQSVKSSLFSYPVYSFSSEEVRVGHLDGIGIGRH